MGKHVHVDIEGQGSLSRARGGKTIHPTTEEEKESTAPPTTMPYMELPLSKKRRSWMVPLFVAANVAVFFVTMVVNDCPKNSGTPSKCIPRFLGRLSFQPLKENPLFGPSSSTLERMGGLEWSKVVQQHQGWQLIACLFLHAGVVHILANMLGLVFIGLPLEQEFGFLGISILYLLSGFGGSLLSALFIQNSISVGASGAVFGLLGAMLSELLTNRTIYAKKCAVLGTLIFIIVNLAVGVLHVDNFAHIGGFISGFLLGFVFRVRPQFGWVNRKKCPQGFELDSAVKQNAYQSAGWLMALIFLIVGYTVGLVVLLRGVNANDHCSWCNYFSCVPTGTWSCRNKRVYCLSSQSASELTLTCQANGKVRIYPFGYVSDDRIRMLCCQLCS